MDELSAIDDQNNRVVNGRFTREEFDRGFSVDPETGLLAEVLKRTRDGWAATKVIMTATAQFDGIERRGIEGGVEYVETTELEGTRLLGGGRPAVHHRGTCVEYLFAAELGGVPVVLIYAIHPNSPAIEIRVQLGGDTSNPRILRQLHVEISVSGPGAPAWRLNVPGNQLRRDLPIADLGTSPVGVSAIGGLRGSSGVIMVTDDRPCTLAIWPNNPSEVANVTLVYEPADRLAVRLATNLSGDLSGGVIVDCPLFAIDVIDGTARDVRRMWPDWASRASLTSPRHKPTWTHGASLYEVQIGASLFRGGHAYCPYPTAADLLDDLDRILALGFTVIQVMPRHPYPSYNVHDYFDITESYGDASDLTELVSRCHRRGVRVILDVLLHGVIDNESIGGAADGVRSGPYAHLLDRNPGDVHGIDISQSDDHSIAWARHILDFEDAWRSGSPERSPLQDAHPQWFFRDSAGSVTGVYTKAFDARHAGWRAYFRRAMLFLLEELGVDGFRFDAPTYNSFANWAPWARDRASASTLACVALFEDLRRDIKTMRPDALMYTEPSGHLLRRSMDLNYNYDEQWLVSALADPDRQLPRAVSTAKQFLEWMDDRDAFLPVGSQTAHHIDSHDTFWWPAWGSKWRREQFGIDATRALAASFMSLDGPFMMFTGGEEGIESLLIRMNELRADSEQFWIGQGLYLAHRSDELADEVLSVRRHGRSRTLDIIVNLSSIESTMVPLPSAEERIVHYWHGSGTEPGGEAMEHTLSPYSVLLVSTPNSTREPKGTR